MPTTATATALVATTVATGPTALATAMDSATARGRLRLSPRLSLLRIRIRPWRLLRWLQDLRSWLRLRPRSVLRQEGGRALLRLRCPRCCPCCEHLRRRPCRRSRRRPRRRVPRRPRRRSRRLQLRPGLPLRLSLHRWHCSRRHPRCRRCLRRCWTLRRQLCWNRPYCQEGGRGWPLLLRRILRTWIRTRLQELRIRSRIRPWILLGLDSQDVLDLDATSLPTFCPW